jgi:DNA-nicking Smr family endonuclease
MAGKRRDTEAPGAGLALWQRVAETVRPLKGTPARMRMTSSAPPPPFDFTPRAPTVPAARQSAPGETLDGGWDRRLRRGVVAPDMTIDLHGHTLLSAQAELEAGLASAILRGARLILLVTGRAPRAGGERIDGRPVRGAIRASVGDWLHGSRHAGHVAAVRNAHPRHGGAGALYIVLRRGR